MTDLRAELQTTLGTAYTIERELGGGGMSRVFVADETRLQRKVVVKVLSPELVQGFSLERFEREIRTAAALQQANIVPVLSASDMNGIPYYTMPFVEGESLRVRLARGPLSITEVLNVLRDVSKALAYAHRQGIVHRDIKPDNVLLSEGTAVVTDFGIAKAISVARTGPGATLTSVGTSIGTPAYMAPEQAAGDPDVDHRADIYSLGAMAYELISGQHVFAGRTPQRMMAAHMTEPPQPVTELRTDIPAPLGVLVMSCLAKDANQRPQSAADITRVLETITSGGSMQAMPPVLLGGPGMFRKALAIYAAAFVVVAIVARAAIVGIGLPEWVFSGSLIVMALGLPVILVTAYVQHVTRRAMLATPTYTPGGTPSGHGTIATMALRAAPHVSWYRTARGGMYAMGVFVVIIGAFMGMRAFGIGPVGSLLATGRLNARDQLLLTDFRTTNADSTLGRVVSDAVRAGLSGTSAFTLVTPNAIVAALRRMQKEPTMRVDSSVARQIAEREGYKAIVDGDITGVAGGYIVTLRLVRADSGIELASFLESGDGPRGLIDAADKLARALRSRAGESLRDVNA
ncbi:MAG: serine/threonine-protein kinase, partial [Gemmatimonadaceae bacterium]